MSLSHLEAHAHKRREEVGTGTKMEEWSPRCGATASTRATLETTHPEPGSKEAGHHVTYLDVGGPQR
jgi:hypothetical protein